MTFQSTTRDTDILELEIADCLKGLLIDYGFTQQRILRLQPTKLASILGIEDYVARIIYNAVKRKS
jgi:hypothetical protein